MSRVPLRCMNFSHHDVLRGHIVDLARVIGQAVADPDACRALRGSVLLGFPSFDDDPRPNWAIPEIRNFVQRADAELPFLPYFLTGEPALEHILFYLICLTQSVDLTTYAASPEELLGVARAKMADVHHFCEAMGDDANSAVLRILLNLPASFAVADPNLAGMILDRIRPTLMALDLSDEGPEATVIASHLLTKAATLLGLDRSQYPSQERLRNEILRAMHARVSDEDVRKFAEDFNACAERIGGGKVAMSSVEVRQLVKEQSQTAYRFVDIQIVAAASQPGYLQPAAMVAGAIYVELGDDEPLRRVHERADELGAPTSMWMPGTG